MTSRNIFIISVILILLSSFLVRNLIKNDKVDFNHDVRPILNERCLACHGGVKKQGGLSFLFIEESYKELESGKRGVVPGKSAKSEVIRRIKSQDKDVQMPPGGDPLSEAEIDILERWIDQGAKYESHWAYVAPIAKTPILQSGVAPSHTMIDHFVTEKLKKNGQSLQEEADRSTLMRRVYLDLIGLPPTFNEAKTFLTDESDNAYESMVDRALSSPHFGERWTSMWLDLARYADSKGYQKDNLRPEIWRYRDWLIDAFNKDMPFDEFTIEQLAGDLLENPTDDQILATAFHRNTMTNDEGGTDDEEYRVAAVIDRVNTTFEVWQGTTIACVQCHSHPYDPILHKEFYNLYAFFNTSADKDDNYDSPTKVLFSPEQKRKRSKILQSVKEYKSKGDTISDEYQETLENFLEIKAGAVQVMQELPPDTTRKTRIFNKGNWLSHGEEVTANTPAFLPSMKEEYADNRLGLAHWLVDGDNPLTARVIVNRFWEQLFGNGIVQSLEDFGTQGFKPSNQDLLDHLALQFSGQMDWSVKQLLKSIVMSKTYKQSSDLNEKMLEEDPNNLLLGRGERYRLSAEVIRDQALAVSGLLNRKVYGPSVMPYQPDGVWNVIRHVDRWRNAQDGDQHRRGIYTFWRRVSPYPSMLTFDAPSREVCVSRRIKTNTPLQALVLMNDPVFTEASDALASRMINEGGRDLRSRISHGYELAMLRKPDQDRLDTLMRFYEEALVMNKEAEDPVLESFEIVANVIFNLDEFLMKS